MQQWTTVKIRTWPNWSERCSEYRTATWNGNQQNANTVSITTSIKTTYNETSVSIRSSVKTTCNDNTVIIATSIKTTCVWKGSKVTFQKKKRVYFLHFCLSEPTKYFCFVRFVKPIIMLFVGKIWFIIQCF